MVSYEIFVVIFGIITAVGIVVGLYIFGDLNNLGKDRMIRGVRNNIKFVILLASVLVFILIENYTHDFVFQYFSTDYSPMIYEMSFQGMVGNTIQNAMRSPVADVFFLIIYIFSYAYMLLFSPLLYMVRDDRKRMKEYALAVILCYIIVLPFYFFFSVLPPEYSGLINTEQIVYSNSLLLEFVKEVDPLDNAFPSGHVAVPIITFFLLLPLKKHVQYRRYAYFTGSLAFLISLSVLYLGAHWFADVFAALIIAIFVVWIAKQKRVMRWFERREARLLKMLGRSKGSI